MPRCEVVCTKRKACQSCRMFSEIAMSIRKLYVLTCEGHLFHVAYRNTSQISMIFVNSGTNFKKSQRRNKIMSDRTLAIVSCVSRKK